MMTLATTCDVLRSCREPARLLLRGARTAVFAAILLGGSSALGQPAKGDRAAADALFQEARKLIKSGDYTAACSKFEASFALYPSAGTLINIGDCHKREGKLATAWGDYRRAVALIHEAPGSKRQDQEDIAAQEIRALEPRLPRLSIVVSHPPAGLKVLRDGKELPAATLGEALLVDPGEHEVRVSAPSYRPETRSVKLEEGKTTTVEISLVALDAISPEKDKPQGGGVPAWAWVTGGAGLALIGAGIYFLADDLAAIGALGSNCHTNAAGTYCASGYDYARDNARKNLDFGLFLGLGGAGVIALGAAAFGVVRAPSSKRSEPPLAAAPWVAPGRAGAMFSGSF